MYMQDGEDVTVVLHATYKNHEYVIHDEVIGGLWLDEVLRLEKHLKL